MFVKTKSTEERFWEKVKKGPACWEWQSTIRGGYGLFKVDGVNVSAHRFSYELRYGKIADGKLLRHQCDNARCVNYDHVIPGTNKENAHDRDSRDRFINHLGMAHHKAKLTDQDVLDIRKAYRKRPGHPNLYDLAEIYHVHATAIHRIINGSGWRHVES